MFSSSKRNWYPIKHDGWVLLCCGKNRKKIVLKGKFNLLALKIKGFLLKGSIVDPKNGTVC